ncbi:MAG: hypothetical protein HUJ98_13485 [Bacteroidaceae bacterium]|nr:hypothetical protein [Bacteroidaceae bacterium]
MGDRKFYVGSRCQNAGDFSKISRVFFVSKSQNTGRFGRETPSNRQITEKNPHFGAENCRFSSKFEPQKNGPFANTSTSVREWAKFSALAKISKETKLQIIPNRKEKQEM